MEDTKLEQSHAHFGERVEKSVENPYGWRNITDVNPADTVCLVLGGQSTTTDSSVNFYCSDIEKLLQKHNLREQVRVMGVVNHYGKDLDPGLARTELMNEHSRGDKADSAFNTETLNPQYINDIYDTFIKPRLLQKGSIQRASVEEACQQMRKLNIYAHCHGGYTAMKLEQLTLQKMAELGYSKNEAAQIQKNLLVVAYAPYCPLGKAKSTMVSFASGDDRIVRHNNMFENTMRYLKDVENKKFPLSYFAGKKGNLFYAPTLGKVDQHEFNGFEPDEKLLNGDGRQMMKMLRQTLINGLKSSISSHPLGEIKDLTANDFMDKQYFDALEQNGEKMWQSIQDYAFQNLRKIQAYAAQAHMPEQHSQPQQETSAVSTVKRLEIFAHFHKKINNWTSRIVELKGNYAKTQQKSAGLSQSISSSHSSGQLQSATYSK